MEPIPFYFDFLFYLSVLSALFFCYKASHHSRPFIFAIVGWLALQAIIGLSGFYTVTDKTPPRFGLLLIPPLLFILLQFATAKGRKRIDNLDAKTLVLLHMIRIPIELTLYGLFLHKAVPQIMTFEGRNFDILCGLTAPIIYYFGYVKNISGRKTILIWNIICLLLLFNVVIMALLSAPFPFQKLAFDQPNIALLYYPYIWLPCFLVPLVMFAHLKAIRSFFIHDKQ